MQKFSPDYVTDRYHTDWGAAINYDGPRSEAVRQFVISNAAYWIAEYHLDGLRVDATQNIYDSSPTHILRELTQAAREAAGRRTIYVVAENEEQSIRHVQTEAQGGYGMDALWNDDLHHTAIVALTGRAQAYYSDYRGTPQEFISAAKYGYLYQGQRYEWQRQNRGTSALRIDPACFVTFLENHDQVANSGLGLRCHQMSSPGALAALTAYLLLGPGTPMLFRDKNSTRPLHFFTLPTIRRNLPGLFTTAATNPLLSFPTSLRRAYRHDCRTLRHRRLLSDRSSIGRSDKHTTRPSISIATYFNCGVKTL